MVKKLAYAAGIETTKREESQSAMIKKYYRLFIDLNVLLSNSLKYDRSQCPFSSNLSNN